MEDQLGTGFGLIGVAPEATFGRKCSLIDQVCRTNRARQECIESFPA